MPFPCRRRRRRRRHRHRLRSTRILPSQQVPVVVVVTPSYLCIVARKRGLLLLVHWTLSIPLDTWIVIVTVVSRSVRRSASFLIRIVTSIGSEASVTGSVVVVVVVPIVDRERSRIFSSNRKRIGKERERGAEEGGGGGGGGGGDSPPKCTRCRIEQDSIRTQVETRDSGRRSSVRIGIAVLTTAGVLPPVKPLLPRRRTIHRSIPADHHAEINDLTCPPLAYYLDTEDPWYLPTSFSSVWRSVV